MSVLSSATVLAAITSVSLGACSRGPATRATQSPAHVYELCKDIRFRCIPASATQERLDATREVAPVQVDLNLATPAWRAATSHAS